MTNNFASFTFYEQNTLNAAQWHSFHTKLERWKFRHHRGIVPVDDGLFCAFLATSNELQVRLSEQVPEIHALFSGKAFDRTSLSLLNIRFDDQTGAKRLMAFDLGDGHSGSGTCVPYEWYKDAVPLVSEKESYHDYYVQQQLRDNFSTLITAFEEKQIFDYSARPGLFNEILLKCIARLSSLLLEDSADAKKSAARLSTSS